MKKKIKIEKKEVYLEDWPDEKSLRWLANMFPLTLPAKDDGDRMSNAIHAYSTCGADTIRKLSNLVYELLNFCESKGISVEEITDYIDGKNSDE